MNVSPVRAWARPAIRWPLLGLVTVLALGAFYWPSGSPSEGRHLVLGEATRGPFTVKLTEMGELRALESVTISAQKDLAVIFLVPEGTFVKEGDELVRFDPGKYEAALDEANAALEVAQAELRKAGQDREALRQKLLADLSRFEADVQLAQLDLDNLRKKPLREEAQAARMEVEKAKLAYETADKKRTVLPELVDRGFITRTALEEADLKYLESKAALQAAQFTLEKVLAGALPDDIEKATIRLDQAKGGLEKAQSGTKSQLQALDAAVDREKANVAKSKTQIEKAEARLKRTELRAPRDGLVVYAKAGGDKGQEKIQLGMIPFEGQPLIYLPDISTMVADTEINEIDIGKVQVGGPVEIRLEAYPGTIFQGKILKLGSLAKLKQSRTAGASSIKVFDLTVKVEGKDPRLKPGLTATLDMIVERQEGVVSVPLSAVIARKGENFVLVPNGRKLEERKVVLGPSNDQRVIVKQGLESGEPLVLGPLPAGSS